MVSDKTKRTDRPRFSEALRQALAKSNKTLTAAAEEMGIPHPRVRQWLARNQFPQDGLVNLAAIANLPTNIEELKKKYDVKITTHGRVKSVKKHTKDTVQYYLPEDKSDDFGADVTRFLRSMDDGESLIVWSIDDLPFEFTNVGWASVGNALASAIYEKGIFCIYVHPSEKELDRLRNSCGLIRLRHEDFFENAFEQFKRNLSAVSELRSLDSGEILLDQEGKNARLNGRQISEHVIRVSAENAAFCSPHHRYVVFVPPGGNAPPSAMAQFPTGVSRNSRPVLLPLAEATAFQLYDFLISCLKSESKTDHRKHEIVKTLAPTST